VRRHHQPDHDPHDQQSEIHDFTPPGAGLSGRTCTI
jgi:hypothetical protein